MCRAALLVFSCNEVNPFVWTICVKPTVRSLCYGWTQMECFNSGTNRFQANCNLNSVRSPKHRLKNLFMLLVTFRFRPFILGELANKTVKLFLLVFLICHPIIQLQFVGIIGWVVKKGLRTLERGKILWKVFFILLVSFDFCSLCSLLSVLH